MTVNMLGSHDASRPSRTVAEWLWPFVPMGIAAFSASALTYYHLNANVFEVRSPLQQLFAATYRTLGYWPSMWFCVLTIAWSTVWLVVGSIERPLGRLLRVLASMVMIGVFLNLGNGDAAAPPQTGALGAWLAETLTLTFGYWASLLVVLAVTLASMLLATDFLFLEQFERLRQGSRPRERELGVEPAAAEHLRGLAETVGPTHGAARGDTLRGHAVAAAAAVPVATADDDAPLPAADLEIEVEPEVPPEPEREAPRRRSYYERRAEREGRSWQRSAEDEWVPAAPESQEIDDPESRPAPVSEIVDEPVPEAAAEAPAAAPDEGERPAEEPVFELPRAQPIVFPGEEATEPPTVAPSAADRNDADAIEGADDAEATGERDEDVVITGINGADDDEHAVEPAAAADDPAPRAAFAADPHELPFASEASTPSDDGTPAEPTPAAAADPFARDTASETDALVDEPLVAIPRPSSRRRRDEREAEPEPQPIEPEAATDAPLAAASAESPARQQGLFGGQLDEALVREAIELVTGSRRASAVFLQRKLRVDYTTATDLLAELAARGVVALEGDASQGRVLG